MMSDDAKAVLVGEANPYGSDPSFALYPLPREAAGNRLRRILRLTDSEYLRTFVRVNLCETQWDAGVARRRAAEIGMSPLPKILLGSKVCAAFRVAFDPFFAHETVGGGKLLVLPHPSGRSRAWNAPGSYDRARVLLVNCGILDPGVLGRLDSWK